jgi:uncharacterized protein (TIGR03067 family)
MMARLCLAGVMLILVGAGGQGEAKQDLQRMEGAWYAQVIEINGKVVPPPDQAKFRIQLVVKGNAYAVYFDGKPQNTGTMALDASKKPKTIDANHADGPHKGKVQLGIYQFVGEEMRVVFGEPGKPRPTDFKTKPGSEEFVISYQRIKVPLPK